MTSALPSWTLQQVRMGKVRPIGRTGVMSGILKAAVHGPVEIGKTGAVGDQQGNTAIHGGPDMALLQYAAQHYPAWRDEFPDSAHLLQPGGFGENLVAAGPDEAGICIGDVVRVGTAVLQVSQPRQPCFKLNHRLAEPTMSRRTQDTGRTGWLYRVLQEGSIAAGQRMHVAERPHPEWSIARIQHVLYTEPGDLASAAVLAGLEVLAPTMRQLFRKRLDSHATEGWEGRLVGSGTPSGPPPGWRRLRVAEIAREADRVVSVLFVPIDETALPPAAPGAHLRLVLPNGLERRYSICEESDGRGFRIAVALSASSTGGSSWLHGAAQVGNTLLVSDPVDAFLLAEGAARHVMVAGGIGVTPFLPMIARLRREGAAFTLHYSGRTASGTPFLDRLAALQPGQLDMRLTAVDPAGRLDLAGVVASLGPGDHLYCCGPAGMMAALRAAASHIPAAQVHFEAFAAAPGADERSFDIELAASGRRLKVGSGETALEALEQAGLHLPSLCRTGTCGSCVVAYRGAEVEHRDFCLSEEQRAHSFAPCVSRPAGPSMTLDL